MALKEYTSFSLDMLKKYHGKIRDWVKSVLPTKTSELENDSGYITAEDVPSQEVHHDDTMTGTGEESTPLSVKEMVGADVAADGGTVTVGSREYEYVKIGNAYWITSNLAEPFGNINADYLYPNGDSANVDEYGLLYKYASVLNSDGGVKDSFKAILPAGWRVATQDDFTRVFSIAGGNRNSWAHCKTMLSTSGWVGGQGNGTNELGLNIKPAGIRRGSSYSSFGTVAHYLIPIYNRHAEFNNSVAMFFGEDFVNSTGDYYSIRLVKDVTEHDGTKGLVPAPSKANINSFLKGDGTWGKPADPVFKAVYNVTPFADIRAAIDAGRSVICDVSGYEYCLAKDDNTSVTFSSTYKDNSGNVTQDSATVTNEGWSAESVTLAKSTDVPTATSQLANDSNFVKVVVSTDPPAEGTPDDVLTAILDGEPQPVVKSDTITRIERVTEVPAEPEDGVLYIVVEEA